MFVIVRSEPQLWTVGSEVLGRWEPVFDGSKDECIELCAKLNGHSPNIPNLQSLISEAIALGIREGFIQLNLSGYKFW